MIRIALVVLLCACRPTGDFHCQSHEQCRNGDEYGFCERSGYCTITDTSCESQRRYTSAGELDGQCLEGVVTGRFVDRYLTNDEMARPIVRERIKPAADVMMSVTLEDGTSPPLDYRELDGAFSFEAPAGVRYELHYVDSSANSLQHSAPHLEIAPLVAGRPVPERVTFTKSTFINFQQTPQITGNVWITSTGLWTETNQGNTVSSFQFNWLNAKSLSGALGLLDKDQHDRLYFLMFGMIDMYSTIIAWAPHDLKQVENMTTSTMATLATVVNRDMCTTLVRTPTMDIARLKMVNPDVTAGAGFSKIEAAPPAELPQVARLQLSSRPYMMPADDTVAVRFVNVYPGTSPVVHTATAYNVPLSYKTNGTQNLALGMESVLPIANTDPSCSGMTSATITTGLAGNLKIGPNRVDADNTAVSLQPPANQDVSWDVAVAGPVDGYYVELWELTDDGAGGTKLEVRAAWDTAEPRLFVPKTLLVSGHEYVFVIFSFQGAPNVKSGDYVTSSLPYEVIGAATHTFVIN